MSAVSPALPDSAAAATTYTDRGNTSLKYIGQRQHLKEQQPKENYYWEGGVQRQNNLIFVYEAKIKDTLFCGNIS